MVILSTATLHVIPLCCCALLTDFWCGLVQDGVVAAQHLLKTTHPRAILVANGCPGATVVPTAQHHAVNGCLPCADNSNPICPSANPRAAGQSSPSSCIYAPARFSPTQAVLQLLVPAAKFEPALCGKYAATSMQTSTRPCTAAAAAAAFLLATCMVASSYSQ